MRDGKARRIPENRAEELIDTGQAKHYISNTVYRAMQFGIEVKDYKTRDQDGKLRAKIREARERETKKREKVDAKREKEERELLEDDRD